MMIRLHFLIFLKASDRQRLLSLNLTSEQQTIIHHGKRPLDPKNQGKVMRVIAGAGTGKTSTLELLSHELQAAGHRVIYLVFNKSAQQDARRRFGVSDTFDCLTIHALALRHLQLPEGLLSIDPVDDHVLQRRIEEMYKKRVYQWLYPQVNVSDKARMRQVVESLAETALFWIFKTLLGWQRSSKNLKELSNPRNTYYPCVLNHSRIMGFQDYGSFYVDLAKEVWDKIWTGQLPVTHDCYLKFAQLGNFTMPGYSTILLDESQDASECQLDLLINQQVFFPGIKKPKNIYVMGDAAQTIYSFRGAKSERIASLQGDITDFYLTSSFRFGSNIAAIANKILWYKEHSPQAKSFMPYRVSGLSPIDGEVTSESLPFPFTAVGRTNAQLILRALGLLVEHEGVKITINGDTAKFKKACTEVLDLLNLKNGERPSSANFSKYKKYDDFLQDLTDKELTQYMMHVKLIDTYGYQLPEKMAHFQNMVLNHQYKASEADVILTTIHMAKGLEYDNVEVLSDLQDLDLALESVSFQAKSWGDDINCWYVAVTRAKKRLRLPEKWWDFQEQLDKLASDSEIPEISAVLRDKWRTLIRSFDA